MICCWFWRQNVKLGVKLNFTVEQTCSFEPAGKEKFFAWTEWVYNEFKPQIWYFERFPAAFASTDLWHHQYLSAEPLHLFKCCIYTCIFSVNTSDEPYTLNSLWKMLFIAFYNFHKVHVCAAQLISQLDTPSLPAHSLEFILKAIAQLVFNLWKVFSLVARFNSRYCCRLIQLPVSTHEGFAAPQFLLFSASPGRNANTPQPQSKKHVFHLFIQQEKTF